MERIQIAVCLVVACMASALHAAELKPQAEAVPLRDVRITGGPFAEAMEANRTYLLTLDVDRLAAPFRREAGLEPKKPSYGDWENTGLDGHTGGHYLAALADMIASGADPDGVLRQRLDYFLSELDACQKASGNGYIGGVPGSKAFWSDVRAGRIQANSFGLNNKWVPWYNVHKTFAGLRDAAIQLDHPVARRLFIGLGDWCVDVTDGLTEAQMQDMLRAEHGGMDEVMADLYSLTGDEKYLRTARRFVHQAVLGPLMQEQDRLTGMHANTQIPKVVGLERIGMLTDDAEARRGAHFFWKTVTKNRSVAFGGNSVSEHFNDPKNFHGLIEHKEGPETCNSYNMLRLTEALFAEEPRGEYADYYERTLFNHILSAINPKHPGYVYFTPLRPGHYRVYSDPNDHFWCCVGTGMENPGRYGKFIYAKTADSLFVNLFIASEMKDPDLGLTLRQVTRFPDEASSRLELTLEHPRKFTLEVRQPGWATEGFTVLVNGSTVSTHARRGSYVALSREWNSGDVVELKMPMATRAEQLPDGSDWVAFLHGPIVLAAPTGDEGVSSFRGEHRRGGHVANGSLIPLDKMPVLLSTPGAAAAHVTQLGNALRFRLSGIVYPENRDGIELIPFFRLHESRYQMYWETTTRDGLAQRQEQLARAEKERQEREAATIDRVAIGEQQPEADHGFSGEGTESGEFQGRRWRHGRSFQYTLDPKGAERSDLLVTLNGGDRDRNFRIVINGTPLAEEHLDGGRPGEFVDRRYPLPEAVLRTKRPITVRFEALEGSLAGGIFDLRLIRP